MFQRGYRLPLAISALALSAGLAQAETQPVGDDVIAAQRAALAASIEGQGAGPQSPRDLSTLDGANTLDFAAAPPPERMNLCNIHFHESAEHKGGQFTTYAGNGDGAGKGTGFLYDGELTEAELAPYDGVVDPAGELAPGDTIELHYVHTTAKIVPGPTLGACLSEAIMNPQLRVEGQVFVIVNDENAANFDELMEVGMVDGFYQAINRPTNTGTPITYDGSTTGPSFNEKASPLQVTWSMRPEVIKVDIRSVAAWLADNEFNEDHGHGVRNLVVNPALLSPIDS